MRVGVDQLPCGSPTTDEEDEMSLTVTVCLKNCNECRHSAHTGAFTPGGAKACCDHPARIGRSKDDDCFKRVIKDMKRIPGDCPLKLGAAY